MRIYFLIFMPLFFFFVKCDFGFQKIKAVFLCDHVSAGGCIKIKAGRFAWNGKRCAV